MIVVDTNIVVYALTEGPQTPLARKVRRLDPQWRLPDLWQHECLNFLATYVRQGGISLGIARRLWLEATQLLAGCVHPVDMLLALQLAVEHDISAYDAQFIAVAQQLGVLCITEDRRLRLAFPDRTRSMQEFCATQPRRPRLRQTR